MIDMAEMQFLFSWVKQPLLWLELPTSMRASACDKTSNSSWVVDSLSHSS